MANKMKNGLYRLQIYLTEEAFEKFNEEHEKYNQTEENEKLSESGFGQLKLSGIMPKLRGAPRGNKNAAGQRRKKQISETENNDSESKKKLWAEEDFDELLAAVDSLGSHEKDEDFMQDAVADSNQELVPENNQINLSGQPNSTPSADQPSLF